MKMKLKAFGGKFHGEKLEVEAGYSNSSETECLMPVNAYFLFDHIEHPKVTIDEFENLDNLMSVHTQEIYRVESIGTKSKKRYFFLVHKDLSLDDALKGLVYDIKVVK